MRSIYVYIHLLLYFFTFYIIVINTRAINDEELIEVVVDTFTIDTDDDRQAEILLTNYRHRLEHSPNLKKLEWAFESQSDLSYCGFCDLVVPLIRLLIETNHTEQFESIINDFCKDFRFIDPVICSGAVHEYQDVVVTVINSTHYHNENRTFM